MKPTALPIISLIALALLFVGCTAERGLPPPNRVQIGEIQCTDQQIAGAVRGGILEGLMAHGHSKFSTVVDDRPDLIISVNVTVTQGQVTSVACTAKRADGSLFGVSNYGQTDNREAPTECGRLGIEPLLYQIRQDQRAKVH
jgi:hypothetical protein